MPLIACCPVAAWLASLEWLVCVHALLPTDGEVAGQFQLTLEVISYVQERVSFVVWSVRSRPACYGFMDSFNYSITSSENCGCQMTELSPALGGTLFPWLLVF